MAALPPPGGGLPSSTPRSFVNVVIASSTPSQVSNPLDPSALPKPGSNRGFHSFYFTDPQLQTLSQSFPWTLVGIFSRGYNKENPKLGRLSLEDLEKYFGSMDLHGDFYLGLLNNQHVLIRLQREDDYLRLFSRMVWYVRGIAMHIFKWMPYFQDGMESSLVLVWVSLPRLPVQFFHKDILFHLA